MGFFERKLRLKEAVLVFMAAIACMKLHHSVDGRQMQQQVPCFFIFGDSLSDSGNNNNLITDAKVNYIPYGVDFPTGATGRFTNGRTQVDFLAELMGFDNFIPPFANTAGSDILKGVNYASGSAGILDETGTHLGQDVCFVQQISNHKSIISEIDKRVGGAENAKSYLNKCLYYVNIGSNDYINNYFMPEHYQSSKKYSPQQYAEVLIQKYSEQLKALYQLGARKFALSAVGHVGCTPHTVKTHGNSSSLLCVDKVNDAVKLFNEKLRPLVDQLKEELFGAQLILVNTPLLAAPKQPGIMEGRKFRLIDEMKETFNKGLKSPLESCCKVGSNGQCVPNTTPCSNRNLHIFWDGFHPTELLTRVMAESAFRAPPGFCYPMDISQLIRS